MRSDLVISALIMRAKRRGLETPSYLRHHPYKRSLRQHHTQREASPQGKLPWLSKPSAAERQWLRRVLSKLEIQKPASMLICEGSAAATK